MQSNRHMRKPSESAIPQGLLEKSESPMKASVFLEMTLHIFHSINIIKQLDPNQYPAEKIVDFKFKKNRKKLVIFDLD